MDTEIEVDSHERDCDESKFFPRRLTHKFTDVREPPMEPVVAPLQNNIEKKAPSDRPRQKKRSRSRNKKHAFEKRLLVQYVKQRNRPRRQQRKRHRKRLARMELETRSALRERVLEKVQEPNRISDRRPCEDAQKRNGNSLQKFLTLQKIERNEENRIGKCIRLEDFITAIFQNEIIKKETPENESRRRLFPCAKLNKLEKEN